MSDDVIVEIAQTTTVVEEAAPVTVVVEAVGTSGPAGPPGGPGVQGEPGQPGTDGGNYTHDQAIASATWVVTHPLTYRPSVTVVDSAGTAIEGDVSYPSPSTVQITFSAAFAGAAYLS